MESNSSSLWKAGTTNKEQSGVFFVLFIATMSLAMLTFVLNVVAVFIFTKIRDIDSVCQIFASICLNEILLVLSMSGIEVLEFLRQIPNTTAFFKLKWIVFGTSFNFLFACSLCVKNWWLLILMFPANAKIFRRSKTLLLIYLLIISMAVVSSCSRYSLLVGLQLSSLSLSYLIFFFKYSQLWEKAHYIFQATLPIVCNGLGLTWLVFKIGLLNKCSDGNNSAFQTNWKRNKTRVLLLLGYVVFHSAIAMVHYTNMGKTVEIMLQLVHSNVMFFVFFTTHQRFRTALSRRFKF